MEYMDPWKEENMTQKNLQNMEKIPKKENIIIAGDFNGRSGK
jgi:hypothetical protein